MSAETEAGYAHAMTTPEAVALKKFGLRQTQYDSVQSFRNPSSARA
jgi:hypothetical protein